jgi:malic enzyme
MAYTPGVARVCDAIAHDSDKAFQYTIKRNTVAVVSDGSAVLGLGDIGPAAAMSVMEGKAMLFGVDAFSLCLDTKDSDEIGRSDYPNQINNVLCFPGIFRGALDVRAREITEEMKMAAARGIAAVVPESDLREDHIIPSPFNRDVPRAVAAAVAEQATREGAAGADPGSIGYAPGDTREFGAPRP